MSGLCWRTDMAWSVSRGRRGMSGGVTLPENAMYRELDRSNGYEAVASKFMALRSNIGRRTIRAWSRSLPSGTAILGLGCGHGVPIAEVLIEDGFVTYGIDASLHLIEAYRRRFPQAQAVHETVEDSTFFDRTFDAIVAIGLLFLLEEDVQVDLIHRVASTLNAGGQFLFTSPEQVCKWVDVLTGCEARSLGRQRYEKVARNAGLVLAGTERDEG